MEGRAVTALVMFTQVQHYEGKSCYQIGYAVPKRYQKQGRAKEIVAAAIREFTSGMKRRESEFYIEAIIDAQNRASQRVAEQLISDSPKEVTDKIAGVPALQYVKHIK
jgi:RimJ/RimL family protein N-acetyltransferase